MAGVGGQVGAHPHRGKEEGGGDGGGGGETEKGDN